MQARVAPGPSTLRPRVKSVRSFRAEEGTGSGAGVDHRLLSAHGFVPDLSGDPAFTDRVFVHDLVLPVRVGASPGACGTPARALRCRRADRARYAGYARHAGRVLVRRHQRRHPAADPFRYVALVETLAERIAAMLLRRRAAW